MRPFGYIMMMAAAATMAAGCQQLDEMRLLPPDQVVPPVLNPLGITELVITNDNLDETVSFAWDAADFGVRAQAAYTIEAEYDDPASGTEGARVAISQGIAGTSYEASYEDINYMLGLTAEMGGAGVPLNTASDVKFYVSASVGTGGEKYYSEPVDLTVTVIYAEPRYPKVWVIGKYCNWEHARSQFLFSFDSNAEYEGVVDFGQNHLDYNSGTSDDAGFKLTGAASWNNATGNWGLGGTAPEDEAEEIVLSVAGGNIANVYEYRYYSFAFNTTTRRLTKQLGFEKFVVKGSAIGNEEKEMTFDTGSQEFYIDAVLEAGDLLFGFADGAERTWLGSLTAGILDGAGENPVDAPAGEYRIYVNLNNTGERTYEFNSEDYGKTDDEEEEITDPTGHTWGLTSDAINGWGADIDPETEETVPDEPLVLNGDYYVIKNVHLNAGEKFKLRYDNKWQDEETSENLSFGGYNGVEVGLKINEGTQLSRGGGDLSVGTAGDYDIYFNESMALIHIREAGSEAPGAVTWGIVGSFTKWADGEDLEMTRAEDRNAGYYVYEGLELKVEDAFKFRNGNAWVYDSSNQIAAGSSDPVSVGTALSLVKGSSSNDIKVAEAGTYDIILYPDQAFAYIIPSGEDFETPAKVSWGVTGTMTDWADDRDILMDEDEEDGYFVIKGLKLSADDEFRLRYGNNDGTSSYGPSADTPMEASSDAHLLTSGGQGKIQVNEAGEYDIYLNDEYGVMYMLESGSEAPAPFSFGIQSNITDGMPDLTMTADGEYFVCKNVWFPSGERNWLKIRVSSNDGITWGGTYIDYDTMIPAVQDGPAIVPTDVIDEWAGAYDVWFNYNTRKIYIMGPGKHPSTAVGEVPEWGIVGHFNNWGNDLKMYMERNIFVYKGLTFENENDESINSNAIKIRLGGSWDAGNIGTSGSDVDAAPGDAISVINDGGSKNIIVPKGTYDIWFDPDAMKVWVMDSGKIPSGY